MAIRKEDPVIQIRAVEDLSVKAFFEKIAEEEANDFASLIPLEDDKIKVCIFGQYHAGDRQVDCKNTRMDLRRNQNVVLDMR